MSQTITPERIENIVAVVPDTWLMADTHFASAQANRGAYVDYLVRRLERPHAFVQEAIRARA